VREGQFRPIIASDVAIGVANRHFLLLVPARLSQTIARKSLPTEPLEEYYDPPAVAAPVLADFAFIRAGIQ
jgi:hypothetical protein